MYLDFTPEFLYGLTADARMREAELTLKLAEGKGIHPRVLTAEELESLIEDGTRSLIYKLQDLMIERANSCCTTGTYRWMAGIGDVDLAIFDRAKKWLEDRKFNIHSAVLYRYKSGDNGESLRDGWADYSIEFSW